MALNMKRFLLFLSLFSITLCVYAQTSIFNPSHKFYSPVINDMRAMGMGKTEVLSTSGSNSAYINPALLAGIQSFQVQLNGRVAGGKEVSAKQNQYSFKSDYPLVASFSGFSLANSWFHNGYFRVAYGIGHQMMHGMNISRDISRKWTTVNERWEVEETYRSNGGIRVLCPALAFGFGEYLAIGFSFNSALSSSFDETYDRWSKYTRTSDGFTSVYESSRKYDGYLGANSATIAAKLKVNRLTVGFVLRSEMDYKFKNINYTTVYSGTTSSGQMQNYDYIVPALNAYAISYQLSDNFLVVGEYQTRNYSDLKEHSSHLNASIYNDGYAQRLGMEYRSNHWLKIRFGLYNEAVFLFDANQGDPNYLLGATAGIGLNIKSIIIDLALDYHQYDYKLVTTDDITAEIEGECAEMGVTISYLFNNIEL